MDKLAAGVQKFQGKPYTERKDLFDRLSQGQAPRTLFITCSDSRIVPSLVTSTEPGDLFVIRNAGNIVPPYQSAPSGEAGTIEYAVAVLKVQHIVVCGHSGCGAMGALLDPDSVKSLPSVARWLELAEPTKRCIEAACGPDEPMADKVKRAIEVNTLRQLDNLRGHPAVSAALMQGKLALHAWVYDIGTGTVTCYDEEKSAFVRLQDTLRAVRPHLRLAVGS